MKKSLLSLTLALSVGGASLVSVSRPVFAAETAAQRAGRAAIVAAYKKSDQGVVKKDVAAIMSFMAPDYEMYSLVAGRRNRAQSEAIMRQLWSGSASGSTLSYTKCTTKILSLTWRGKDAIVMCQATAVGTARRGARASRIEQVSVTRDFWSPTAQGWKVRQSVERDSKIWIDGKRTL